MNKWINEQMDRSKNGQMDNCTYGQLSNRKMVKQTNDVMNKWIIE